MKKTKNLLSLLFVSCLTFTSCSTEDSETFESEELSAVELRSTKANEFSLGDGSNLKIEHSWETDCEDTPCDTNTWDEDLSEIVGGVSPDEPYFYENSNRTFLNLKCQEDKGRRIEFKQITKGPLDSKSQMDFKAVYYDIPDNGIIIAQVHNRGSSIGKNKPFFRVVLYKDYIETLVREDPEVDSNLTNFIIDDWSLGGDYDKSSLRVILTKNNDEIKLQVKYKGEWIINNEKFEPQKNTDWLDDEGINNGFYLKAGLYNDVAPYDGGDLRAKYTSFYFTTEDED